MAPVYSQPLTSGEKINNDKIKEIVKQIVYSKFDAVNTLDPNRMSLVALEFNILLNGISGIGRPYELKDGDKIKIGTTVFKFRTSS